MLFTPSPHDAFLLTSNVLFLFTLICGFLRGGANMLNLRVNTNFCVMDLAELWSLNATLCACGWCFVWINSFEVGYITFHSCRSILLLEKQIIWETNSLLCQYSSSKPLQQNSCPVLLLPPNSLFFIFYVPSSFRVSCYKALNSPLSS